MARASRTGGKTKAAPTRKKRTVKGRNPAKPKRPVARTVVRAKRSSVSPFGNELQEAREQQAATAAILKVIASSPNDVQPVFNAIVNSAATLFAPCTALITMLKEGKLHWNAFATLRPDFDFSGAA